MSAATDKLHREWLNLIDVSGPFLTLLVLGEVFPQGLDGVDSSVTKRLRTAHEEWTANNERRQPDRSLHRAWVEFVLEDVLDWPEEALVDGPALPPALIVDIPEHGARLRPDLALMDDSADGDPKPRVLVAIWPPDQDLEKAAPDKRWAASPAARMAELLRGAGVRLGLVTNGEQWMLVDAPRGETAAFVTWEATLWLDEPLTLRAFVSLLGALRILAESEERTLEALLARSKQDQAEVTTKLGNQVRHAVELLVRSIDRADRARNGELLAGVSDEDLYEAAITVMMRLVFLLFAEDQRPPLIGGTPLYTENYAVSPLRDQLRASVQGNEDVLERRHDAWARLLAVFRLVHAGSEHEDMRFPPYGGSLFDPDRFPFLEGRSRKTRWVDELADPLLIDNRVVLHLLDAIQQLGGQRISFRGLDVEQIGHVYENLLGHMARRAEGPTLALQGKLEPEVSLAALEDHRARGEVALIAFLKEATGKSANALGKSLAAGPDLLGRQRLLEACDHDDALLSRVLPFAGLIRDDDAGRPLVIPTGGRYVTAGSDRKNLGAHYTPRSLTEPIVRYALEPLVYDGPAEGKPAEEWTLHSPQRLLSLKICDPAMGSGAFLVQACRYLSERLLEAWDAIEAGVSPHPNRHPEGARPIAMGEGLSPLALRTGRGGQGGEGFSVPITPEGRIATGAPGEEILPQDRDERLAVARRIVADRCLYGVDKNHLAVEMAKLSLWLTTLQKDRPFTFVDHALRGGDSLLGIASLDQLTQWSLNPKSAAETHQTSWFTRQVSEALEEATRLREQITATDVRSVADAAAKTDLLRRSEMLTGVLRLGADLLVAAALHPDKTQREILANRWRDEYSITLDGLRMIAAGELTTEGARPTHGELSRLRSEADDLLGGNRPFHWPLEYPEVVAAPRLQGVSPGFAAIVGNPPFQGGKRISGSLGNSYREYLVDSIANGARGNADLVAYFLLRAARLLRLSGAAGLLATNTVSQGGTREVGLGQLTNVGDVIYRAVSTLRWPGTAGVEVAQIWLWRGNWLGSHILDEDPVGRITPFLVPLGRSTGDPARLVANADRSFIGSLVLGTGFIVSSNEAHELIARCSRNKEVLFPYLNGEDLNSSPSLSATRWIINFFDWPIEQAATYEDCFRIVLNRVRPERQKLEVKADASAQGYARLWWQYGRRGESLYKAIEDMQRVVARSRISSTWAWAFLPNNMVYDAKIVVLASDDDAMFGLVQSSFHLVWSLQYGTTLKRDLSYTPTTNFETFPFPSSLPASVGSKSAAYHQLRAQCMRDRKAGLTKIYHRCNDPSETASDITRLRQIGAELDQLVSEAYGWDDLDLLHGFHETKQGLRFTISEAARREVLDRLLELNHQRHAEEVALGLVDESGKILKRKVGGAGRKGTRRKTADPSLQPALGLE